MKEQRPPSEELLKFLSVYDWSVGEIALGLRELLLSEAPAANEFIYDAYNAVALGYSFTDRWQEGFCHIAVYSRYVNLGFNRGAELPDPDGLLKGTGKLVRHIRVASKEDLQRPQLRKYLRTAIKQIKSIMPAAKKKTITAQSIVKSISANKRRPVKTG